METQDLESVWAHAPLIGVTSWDVGFWPWPSFHTSNCTKFVLPIPNWTPSQTSPVKTWFFWLMLAKDKNGRHKLSKFPEPGSGLVQLLLNKTGLQRPGVDFKGTKSSVIIRRTDQHLAPFLYESLLLSLPTYLICTIAAPEKCAVHYPVWRTKAANGEILQCPMSRLGNDILAFDQGYVSIATPYLSDCANDPRILTSSSGEFQTIGRGNRRKNTCKIK